MSAHQLQHDAALFNLTPRFIDLTRIDGQRRVLLQWQAFRPGEVRPYHYFGGGVFDSEDSAARSALIEMRCLDMGIKMYKTELFPYIEGGQLLQKGDVILTMDHVEKEVLHNGEVAEDKYILHFKETRKGLVLNKTNVRAAIAIAGSDDTDDWAGVKVGLTTERVKAFGKLHNAVRLVPFHEAKVAKKKAAKQTEQTPDTPLLFEHDDVEAAVMAGAYTE